MIGRIKYRLLQWLIDDILKNLNNKPGCNVIRNIRARAEIELMAKVAWRQ